MRSLGEPGKNYQPEEIDTTSKAGVRSGVGRRGTPVFLAPTGFCTGLLT